MKYDNEEKFVDELESALKSLNYKTWREVSPDEHSTYELPFKVDLIFYHPIIGFVGIEAKNTRSIRQGSLFAQAVRQIEKYKKLHYFGGKQVSRWCVAVPNDFETMIGKNKQDVLFEVNIFIRTFLNNMYNISVIDFNDYGVHIDAGTNHPIYIKQQDEIVLPSINYNVITRCLCCGAELDIEDEVCPYCGLKKEGECDD